MSDIVMLRSYRAGRAHFRALTERGKDWMLEQFGFLSDVNYNVSFDYVDELLELMRNAGLEVEIK